MSEDTSQFNKTKYLSLETYRKNGIFVRTPVWFVVEDKDFFVITKSETGKVKRLRNNPKVRISPCNFRGKIKGKWVDGFVTFKDPLEYPQIIKLRNKKYGLLSKIISLFTLGKGKLIIISIRLV
ncbi:MAG: PPOX class F420-dependent oxidoreductase [Candidatus Nitrosocosmicus sp.]